MPARILYVDDDPTLARLAQRVLARHRYDIVHAASVAEGLEVFAGGGFDAVVLDHYFRENTGLDFLEAVSETAEVPIVYVTGSSDAQVAITALKSGAADYVIKTATEEFFPLLVSAIRQSLETARLRKAKQEADRLLVQAKERAELMMAEMNHRVANSLALVTAMIRLQINTLKGEEAKTALAETQSRIAAIAGLHRSLYTSDDVGNVQLEPYLRALVEELQRSGGGQAVGRATVSATIEPFNVPPDRAVALGVILTELISNALKYAYPGGAGEVRVRLSRASEEGVASLVVEDDGVGFNPEDGPSGTGLGTKLIRAMCTTLAAEVKISSGSDGTTIRLTWPH